ncbi:MAG: response regulator transcription factor [Nitriliruptorales bacterium]|nr:response regulator transcription factor [Nitriliruptorales bacterium]
MDRGPDTPLRLVVADDSPLLREGVVNVLSARGFDVVAEASDAEELVSLVGVHEPDVAVADIRMPPTGTDDGLRAADVIAKHHPGVGVLVLSEYVEPQYAIRLIDQGAPGRGYLLKQTITDWDAFAEGVRRVADGGSVLDPVIVQQIMERQRVEDPLAALSDREREILSLMAEGRSNRAIAEQLVLSDRTVESHVRAVFQKLGLDDTPDDHRRVLAVVTYLRS